jgi:ABC-type branched-subunit amino acid transport system ATPase component
VPPTPSTETAGQRWGAGIAQVVCDEAALHLGRQQLSVLQIGDRLLVLPVVPVGTAQPVDPSLAAQLGIVEETVGLPEAVLVPEPGNTTAAINVHETEAQSRLRSVASASELTPQPDGGPAVDGELALPVGSSSVVSAALASRAGPPITLRHVTCRTAGSEGRPGAALLDATFEVRKGDFVVLVGATKPSSVLLFNVLTARAAPDVGLVVHFGRKADPLPIFGVEAAELPHVSVREFVAQRFHEPNREAADTATQLLLSRFHLLHLADMGLRQLSEAERRSVSAASAFASRQPLRCFVEPLVGAPPDVADAFIAGLASSIASGEAVLMLSDDPRLIRAASRVVGVVDGRLLEATVRYR